MVLIPFPFVSHLGDSHPRQGREDSVPTPLGAFSPGVLSDHPPQKCSCNVEYRPTVGIWT
jgi:hypothetical protein